MTYQQLWCLIQDPDEYRTEEEAEKWFGDYWRNPPSSSLLDEEQARVVWQHIITSVRAAFQNET